MIAEYNLSVFLKAWAAARERGEVDVPRDQVLFFETPFPGVVIVNTSRITGLDPTAPFQLSKAESIGRKQCTQILRFLQRHAVDFPNSVRMDTAAKVGVRESRHIEGLYTLTADDIVTARHFDDCIALGGYPIDIHAPGAPATRTTHLIYHRVAASAPYGAVTVNSASVELNETPPEKNAPSEACDETE